MSIYSDDLNNRFPTYTFTESTNGDLSTVDADNGGPVLNSSTSSDIDGAYKLLRSRMVGGDGILPILTTTQRDALVSVDEGRAILNTTTTSIDRYESGQWVPDNEIIEGNYNFQGSVKIGGDVTIEPLGALHVIGDDAETARIRTIRFQDNAAGAAAVQIGHSRGTESSPSALLSGDRIGQLLFVGGNGSVQASNGPVIRGFTTENWGGSSKGSRIDFLTLLDGTTAHNLAFRISENGYPEMPEYTVATLPPVGNGGGFIPVTDETGGYTMAFSDGTNWRRVQDRAIVS